MPCPSNMMANYTGAFQCQPCPAGFYCLKSGVPIPCTKGYYCPAGTGHDLRACPRGTIGTQEQYLKLQDCQPCPAGKFCANEHATNYTGRCAAGHWCLYGVDRANPIGVNITSTNTTFNATCPYYYDGRETGKGGKCPVGHYCPVGTSIPISCAPGTYSPVEQLASCYPCMEGYYCPHANMTDYHSYPCPMGHYCPNGTKTANENPCPKGKYNDQTKRIGIHDCISCKPGKYCPSTGNDIFSLRWKDGLTFCVDETRFIFRTAYEIPIWLKPSLIWR